MTQHTSKFLLAYALVKVADWEDLHFHKGHNVFEDGNVDDESIRFYINLFHEETKTWDGNTESKGDEEYWHLLFKTLLELSLDERIVLLSIGGYGGFVSYPNDKHRIMCDIYVDDEFRRIFRNVCIRYRLEELSDLGLNFIR